MLEIISQGDASTVQFGAIDLERRLRFGNVSDVIMPGGMDGVELAQEIHRNFPSLPVLLTSGYNDAIEKVNAAGLAFIVKPYRTEELTRKIRDLLIAGVSEAEHL